MLVSSSLATSQDASDQGILSHNKSAWRILFKWGKHPKPMEGQSKYLIHALYIHMLSGIVLVYSCGLSMGRLQRLDHSRDLLVRSRLSNGEPYIAMRRVNFAKIMAIRPTPKNMKIFQPTENDFGLGCLVFGLSLR
jgi:hypothetical protein